VTPAELAALLGVATDPADRTLILLAGHAGTRAGELVALGWEDGDLDTRWLVILAGKGGKWHTVGLSRRHVSALADLRPDSPTGPVLGLPGGFAA